MISKLPHLVIQFPDPNLEAFIRTEINKPTGDIYEKDVNRITYLNASEQNISNISGLEHFTSLAALHIYSNSIIDLSPLDYLSFGFALFLVDVEGRYLGHLRLM